MDKVLNVIFLGPRGLLSEKGAAEDSTCASPKLHPAEKLNKSLDILTVKSRLDRPTRARWKAMKIQADGILAWVKSNY
jgi:hypothetical protein